MVQPYLESTHIETIQLTKWIGVGGSSLSICRHRKQKEKEMIKS